jgi:hypothetical protein
MQETVMKKPVVKSAAKAPSSSRKSAPKATAGQTRSDAPSKPAKNILTAGIKALTHAHEEAVARQSRVFESLLGLGPRTAEAAEAPSAAATTLDPFGFRKFEDVFDQRVARALQNLQVPTAQAFADLTAEVERLRHAVATLEEQAQKPAQKR